MKGVTAEVSDERGLQESHEGVATARELLGKESADLWGRAKRMSVRDLAIKFESGQAMANAAAAILAQEVLIGISHSWELSDLNIFQPKVRFCELGNQRYT